MYLKENKSKVYEMKCSILVEYIGCLFCLLAAFTLEHSGKIKAAMIMMIMMMKMMMMTIKSS